MKVNKIDKLQFIHNGRQITMKIKFYGYVFCGIPLFTTDIIEEYSVILLDDMCILVVINEKYLDNSDIERIEIGIFDKLLRYQLDTEVDILIDMHLAKWFSSSSVIKYINTRDISDIRKQSRVNNIEKHILCSNNLNIHDKQYVINNLRFIEINELEMDT